MASGDFLALLTGLAFGFAVFPVARLALDVGMVISFGLSVERVSCSRGAATQLGTSSAIDFSASDLTTVVIFRTVVLGRIGKRMLSMSDDAPCICGAATAFHTARG